MLSFTQRPSCRGVHARGAFLNRIRWCSSLRAPRGRLEAEDATLLPPSDAKGKEHLSPYEFLVQRLYQVNRFTAVKLGIENMRQLHAAFGEPSKRYEIIHVAGTNGKGSVAHKVAKALERAGYKTGLFVSPHVSCFRERIQVNGQLISEEQVCETLSEVFNVSAQLRIPATFFEITTMLALQHYAKQNVDCVVLETGLGGRLDATNIVQPVVSAITSIGLDHMRILGSTIEQIAHEKAGIIKCHVPVVMGPKVPLDVMTYHSAQKDAKLVQIPWDSHFEGDYNAENTAIARQICVQLNELSDAGKSELHVDVENERVRSALESRPACRFQVLHMMRPNSSERKVTIVLDVAHNAPAIASLVRLLRKRFPRQKLRFVCGFSADKDIPEVLKTLVSACERDHRNEFPLHLVRADHPRGATLEEIHAKLKSQASSAGSPPGSIYGDLPLDRMTNVAEGVNDAVGAARASPDEEIVVVCGSVFLMSEARTALGFKDPTDSPALLAAAGQHLSTPASRLASEER